MNRPRPFLLSIAAAAGLAAVLLGGCAGGIDSDNPGPPHRGAVNPWSNGGFSDAGPNYPATGH